MLRHLAFAAVLAAASISGQAAFARVDYSAALADGARTDEDRAADANRRPAEMLAFAGVEPGDVVMELIPGGGYFTRVLSPVVGEEGKVYAAVPAANLDAARAAAKGNVSVIATGEAPPEPVDLIFTAQNYHDLHLARLNIDVAAFNKGMFAALKPGGTLLVIDHAAEAGAPLTVADTLHRIDPAKARAELEAAGFVFEGESDALRNPDDPKTIGVFDPSIRGKTDQFVYRFRKPA